jgi:hypothetical protein
MSRLGLAARLYPRGSFYTVCGTWTFYNLILLIIILCSVDFPENAESAMDYHLTVLRRHYHYHKRI